MRKITEPLIVKTGRNGVGVEISRSHANSPYIRIEAYYDGGFELHDPVDMPLKEFLAKLGVTTKDLE